MASAFVAKEYKAFNYFCCIVSLLFLSASIGHAGSILTYQGRILKSDGSPVKTPTSFTISITNPSGNCILWAEPFSSSMSSGDGSFSFAIGAGTRSDAGTKEFKDIFSDGIVISPNSSCPAGYTKLSSDILKLKVSFNDGTGAQSLPAMDITAVPFAIEAQKVAGVASENVLRVSDGAATPLSSSSFTELLALLNGSSTKYLKNDVASGASLPKMTSDPSGLGPGDAGNIIYRSDTKEIRYWDGASFQTISAASGITSLIAGTGLTGGTINSSGQTIAVDAGLAANKIPMIGATSVTANQVIVSNETATALKGKTLADGQVLIGSTGAAPVPATLTAGSGVSITNAAGSITISASGSAPSGAASGDLSDSYPNPKVTKINGVSVGTAAAADDGKYLKFINGTGWVPEFVKLSDLRNGAGTASAFSVGSCSAKQTMAWSSLTDQFTCQDIGSLDAGAITSGTLPASRGGSRWTASASDIYFNSGKVGVGTTAPNSTLEVGGAIATALSTRTAAYTLTDADSVLMANASSGAFTVTLPSAVGIAGRQYTIKKTDSSTNAVTVSASGGQTIDGSISTTLSSQYQFVTVVTDGTQWFVTSTNKPEHKGFVTVNLVFDKNWSTTSAYTAKVSISGSGYNRTFSYAGFSGAAGTVYGYIGNGTLKVAMDTAQSDAGASVSNVPYLFECRVNSNNHYTQTINGGYGTGVGVSTYDVQDSAGMAYLNMSAPSYAMASINWNTASSSVFVVFVSAVCKYK